MGRFVMIVLVVYGVMSVVTFVAMWRDKRASMMDSHRPNRTPETTLHIMELLGGWPGTLAAQRLVRHKNRKRSYIAVLWLIIVLHGAAWAAVGYYAWS